MTISRYPRRKTSAISSVQSVRARTIMMHLKEARLAYQNITPLFVYFAVYWVNHYASYHCIKKLKNTSRMRLGFVPLSFQPVLPSHWQYARPASAFRDPSRSPSAGRLSCPAFDSGCEDGWLSAPSSSASPGLSSLARPLEGERRTPGRGSPPGQVPGRSCEPN